MDPREEVKRAAALSTDDYTPGALAFGEAWSHQYGAPLDRGARAEELAAAYDAGYHARTEATT